MIRHGDPCPVCGRPISESRLPYGFVYCVRGHVTTVAAISEVDPAALTAFAAEYARTARPQSHNLG